MSATDAPGGEDGTPHWRVAIIGAGAGGLGLAISLVESGRRDFVVFEATDGVGGTWRVNTYPGAACDVPSHLYSYSFALKPDWSKTYAEQPEILQYFEECADGWGVRPHLRIGVRITSAQWDAGAGCWRLRDDEGRRYSADVVVSAIGTFTTPSYPDLAGLDAFDGPCFHSARWEHEHDLSGRRIAVIGTGASSAQIVPELAKLADRVDVYQRTPQWILPRRDKPFSEEEKQLFATNREAMEKHREEIFWAFENTIAFRLDDPTADGLREIALSHIDYRIKDEALKAKLTPDYPFGCKRTLVCSDFYKAVLRDNVEVITVPIDHVTPRAVVTADGTERPVDAIVLATGFKATEYLEGIEVVGSGGRRLHDDWAEVAHAYLGLTVSGYPNFFMMYGPNTNQGGNSIIVILEAQATYVVSALNAMRDAGVAVVDVRRGVMARYNDELTGALEGTVWHHGCQSYFKNANGKIATQLPQTSLWYAERTKQFEMEDYERV
ncbi:MAG TPA: NAD(P)/FAD-dependent oxidoreductase [Acidimicrobiales bacterium]|nr:NAD(P)/FAD-dependent oxidoreductase [Acidimicrobiales bacterium]